jgi:hypothetical protein
MIKNCRFPHCKRTHFSLTLTKTLRPAMLYFPPPSRRTLSLSHLPPFLGSSSEPSLSQRHCLRAALAACSTLRSSSLRPLFLRSSLGVRLRKPPLFPRPRREPDSISVESSRTGRVARQVSGSSSSSPALPGRDQRPLLPGEPNERADEELK